jgi:hypothetical protein
MATTYTKLRSGSWGVRSTERLVPGQRVTVTKKDGTTKAETIERVIWTDGTVSLASIAQSDSASPSRKRSGCGCDCEDCSYRCQCDPHCVCRGGNIYDC